jgi:energy-coupling factor transport system ATP-binding protein
MIRFDGVTITYPDAPGPALRDVHLDVPEGELALVVGRTGAGKSTMLGAVNGLVPHFTGGRLAGRVTVDGRDTRSHPPRELADVVGVVGQDPLAGFVTDTVEEELAYGMEQLAVPPATMRRRVEEVLDLLGLADVRRRALADLSGGQQQRVAIGAVLTAHPRVLVLDEPTSALDPTAAEDVLAAVTRLVHDLGTTVLLAEHRLERVVQYADRLVHVGTDGTVTDGDPAHLLAAGDVAPPVVELGRLAGWHPLPLSVRDARRRATDLRERLTVAVPGRSSGPAREAGAAGSCGTAGAAGEAGAVENAVLTARGVVVRYGDVVAVRGVDLDLRTGEVVALMGRNGSGKSSLLWAVQGSGRRDGGTVRVGISAGGTDPGAVPPARARALVGLVPQTPADLLYLETVAEELAQADEESGAPAGTADELLERLSPGVPREAHPRDLSEGQRLALVLAVQLVAAPSVLLLDEPTRGLDYGAKERLSRVLRGLAADGHAVVVSTHDVEFVAAACDRVVVMAEGEVVADGATADVVTASPAFAPQVAKVLAPLPLLTVAEVAAALAVPAEGDAR